MMTLTSAVSIDSSSQPAARTGLATDAAVFYAKEVELPLRGKRDGGGRATGTSGWGTIGRTAIITGEALILCHGTPVEPLERGAGGM